MSNLVGIDASRYLADQRTGTENYSYQLLNALALADHPNLHFRLYLNSKNSTEAPVLRQVETRAIPFPRFWTHARLSAEMLTHRPELLFVPSHVIPLIHPRSVVTIHDLGYLHEPDAHPARQRLMLDRTARWNARVASKIIAISNTTRNDLVRHYGVADEKITVLPHGVGAQFQPVTSGTVSAIRARLGLPDQFVLAVGTIHPRKNLGNLAKAVRLLRDEGRPIALVTAGKHGWLADQVEREILAALPETAWRHLGYVPDADLPALYGAADAVLMVSRYEGFGLPVLEAMASGAPVVISDRGALPEVAGGCALIAECDDPPSIARQIARLIDDAELRNSIIQRGIVHASTFTWERAAQSTIDVLREALPRN